MSLDAVIAKIQKLRRLATSSNVNEAAAAAAAADRLIQEHNLAEAQLQAEGHEDTERPEEDADPLFDYGPRIASWSSSLIARLSRHYGCSGYQASFYNADAKRTEWRHKVIGRPSDVATLRYMIAWLTAEIERLAQQNSGRGRAWLNSFRHGAVAGVCNAMYEERRGVQEQTEKAGASAAIVLVNSRHDASMAERDRLHPDLKSSTTGRASDWNAYREGERAGRNVHRGGKLAAGAGHALPAGGGT